MGANAAIGMMALGTGMSAKANRASGKANQQIAEHNALLAEMQADDAIARGREDESRHRITSKGIIGAQRLGFAAAGVDISDPDSTASAVTENTAALSEIDALTIRSNAAREAWGYRRQAENSRYSGKVARMEGDNRAMSSIIGGASTVLYNKYGFNAPTRGTKT